MLEQTSALFRISLSWLSFFLGIVFGLETQVRFFLLCLRPSTPETRGAWGPFTPASGDSINHFRQVSGIEFKHEFSVYK